MRMKGFEERHSIDQGNEEHLDIQDCEIPRDKEKCVHIFECLLCLLAVARTLGSVIHR